MQGILDGDANAPLDLAQQVDGIVDYWSLGRRETVTLEDGSTVRVPIFDEGMTVVGADGEVIEAGAIHLETVKAMARETVYAFWGEMISKKQHVVQQQESLSSVANTTLKWSNA